MAARVVAGTILLSGLAFALALLPTGGPSSVSAVPRAPHVFYGRIADGAGSPIASGVAIEARIGNVHYAQSVNSQTGQGTLNTRTHAESGGLNYGSSANFQVCADDTSTLTIEGGNTDDAILFYVNGVLATTSISPVRFIVGGVTQMDMTISSLDAPKAAAATPSSNACTTQEEIPIPGATSTPTPTSTPTSTPAPTATPGVIVPPPPPPPPPPPTPVPTAVPTQAPTPTVAQEIVQIVSQIGSLPPAQAADVVEQLTAAKAADVLEQLSAARAADIIEEVRTAAAVSIITNMDVAKAADLIEELSIEKSVAVFELISVQAAATILESVSTQVVADILSRVSADKAADVMEMMDVEKAVAVVKEMDAAKASDILSRVSPDIAGLILEGLPFERLADIVGAMAESRLIERLPEMSPGKLFGMPIQVLFRRLLRVPVETFASERRPVADPGLRPPTIERRSPTRTIYTIQRSGLRRWAKLVGSPAFIEGILGKFNRDIADLGISVEELAGLPAGLPSLGDGQVVDQVFEIEMENAEPDDVASIHVAFYVSKTWLNDNGLHKWSVQLHRFDQELGMWVSFPAKRVSEDDERISYTVAIPGFSVIAITGSKNVPAPIFDVADLSVTPKLALSGEEVRISARVRNTSSETAVYPANLWIDETVEESKAVKLGPGEAATISFSVQKPQGEYSVRVERLLGDFSVSAQAAATATPRPATPAPTAVPPTPTPGAPTVGTATPTPTPTPGSITTLPSATATPSGRTTPVAIAQTATPGPGVIGASPTTTATPRPPLVSPQSEGGGLNLGAILGIVVGIIAVLGAAVIYFTMFRKKG